MKYIMNEIGLNELKKIQVDILKDIHTFCQSANLKYSLSFGTLIGAVRHKGYIPWDDDVDIMMPRKDYDIFIRSFKSENCMVIDHEINKSYIIPFAKVYDKRTSLIENVRFQANTGVYVDVFPIDTIPNSVKDINSLYKRKRLLYNIYKYKISKGLPNWNILKKTALKIIQLFLSPITFNQLLKVNERNTLKYQNDSNSKAGEAISFDSVKSGIINKDVFDDYMLVDFEGEKFYSIKKYDEFLCSVYGDYMILPPIDKRVTHHSFKAFWI